MTLALLPLLVAIMGVVLAGYLLLIADAKARHTCRVEILRAQEEVAKNLNALLALNPRARVLRLRRAHAEAKVLATVALPAAHLRAQAELKIVIREQVELADQQKKLLLRTEIAAKAVSPRTLNRTRQRIRETENRHAGDSRDGWRSAKKNAVLAVVPTPANSLTPDYMPDAEASTRLDARVSFSLAVTSLLPDWLRPLVDAERIRTQAECSATLEKEDSKWVPRLTAAKPRSNS